jgi:hypothetical protein
MKPSKRHAQLLGRHEHNSTLAQTAPESELMQASNEALANLLQVKYGATGMFVRFR